jgi:glycosyltransferase involved in cell wall biosynthesis
MRIALIALGRRGAGGPFSLELARHLNSRAEVVALLAEKSESLPAWKASGVAQTPIPTYRTAAQALRSYFQPGRFRKIAGIVRAWQPDVLLFPMFYTWNPFIQLQLPDIPSVVTVHDPIPHPGLAGIVYRWMEDASIRRAGRCLVLSQSLQDALVRRGVTGNRIDHLPHGLLSGYYQELGSAEPAQPDQPFTLLFFGRITQYKGLEVLLQAYRQVRSRHPVRLLVVGEGDLGPYQALLQDLPEVEVVNRWVREDEVDAYFRQAGLLVLPYTSASQSGVLTIAAGYALPVLSTRVGGIPEQLRDADTGILVDPGSVDQLTEAIEKLIARPELRSSLGKNLQQDYQNNRSWDQIAAQAYAACEKAVEEHARSGGR